MRIAMVQGQADPERDGVADYVRHLTAALRRQFPQWQVPDVDGGLALWVNLGAPVKTLEEEISELRNAEKVEAELEAMKAARKEAA